MVYFILAALLMLMRLQTKIYNAETSRFTVLFANYRDILCMETLKNIFYRSNNPGRMHVIITQETYPGDDDCYTSLKQSLSSSEHLKFQNWLDTNLSIIRKKASDAVGLHMNVYQAQLLLQHDDPGFVMKIDSHSDFLPSFDTQLINLFNKVGDEKAVFSNHALNWSYRAQLMNNFNPSFVSTTCALMFLKNNIFFLRYNEFLNPEDFSCFDNPGACHSSLLVASNIFGRAHFMQTVPYDKYMSFLFFGEEPLYAIRLFTYGYNLYLPKYNYVFHYAQPNKTLREKFEMKRNFDEQIYQKTLNRFRKVLGLKYDKENVEEREIEKFGMGKIRTVSEYFKFIGVEDYIKLFEKAEKKNIEDRSACEAFKKLNGVNR